MNILSLENITHSYTERKLFDNTSFYLHEGEKVGVIGINGTGKSTLLKIMAGLEVPDEGEVIKASNMMIHYLPQNPKFNDGDTVLESVQNMIHHHANENELVKAKSMMTRLGITDFEQKTGELSGGQRKRLALVSVLITPCDILILDEPTNHLDITSKEILEQALLNYTGTVLYVSHDRYFINKTATRILDLTGQTLINYIGNYDYYLEKKEHLTSLHVAAASEAETAPAESDTKLDWKQQKEEQARLRKKQNAFKKVEEEILALETRNEEIDSQLAEESVYSDVAKLMEFNREKEEIAARLETLYAQWEELAE